MYRENRNVCIFSVGKSEGKRPFGRPEGECEGNIKIDRKYDGSRLD
jgi:hypothetical protein